MRYRKRWIFTVIIVFIAIQCFSTSTVFADNNISALVYHHILPENMNTQKRNGAIISMENFEKQMNYLYKNNYNTITLDELYSHIRFGHKLPQKSVLITFDDGYESNYIFAYPILKKYGFKASIFMITSEISNRASDFDPRYITFMSREQIEKSMDVFEFACHTHNLHRFTPDGFSILTQESDENIEKDLHLSRGLVNSKYFAYPYGKYDKRLESILEHEGFNAAFTIKSGIINRSSDIYELSRNIIFSSTSLEEFAMILGRASY